MLPRQVHRPDEDAAQPDGGPLFIRRAQVFQNRLQGNAGVGQVPTLVAVFEVPQEQVRDRHRLAQPGFLEKAAGFHGGMQAGGFRLPEEAAHRAGVKQGLPAGKGEAAGLAEKRAIAQDGVQDRLPFYGYLDEYNTELEALCQELDVTFIDSGFILRELPELYDADGIHPVSAFYPLWFNYLADMAVLKDNE